MDIATFIEPAIDDRGLIANIAAKGEAGGIVRIALTGIEADGLAQWALDRKDRAPSAPAARKLATIKKRRRLIAVAIEQK
jgi:hypothetical protein